MAIFQSVNTNGIYTHHKLHHDISATCPLKVPVTASTVTENYIHIATIHHHGPRHTQGHYTTQIKNLTNNNWTHYDDDQPPITPPPPPSTHQQPYLFFYLKAGSPDTIINLLTQPTPPKRTPAPQRPPNIGNTCYAGSTINTLLHIPTFRDHLTNIAYHTQHNLHHLLTSLITEHTFTTNVPINLLGLQLQLEPPNDTQQVDLPRIRKLLGNIKDNPCARAGIQVGDFIHTLNHQPITSRAHGADLVLTFLNSEDITIPITIFRSLLSPPAPTTQPHPT
jgi:hypothetical protein